MKLPTIVNKVLLLDGGNEAELLKHALEVSPYNAIGYGMLVALCLFASWLFYRNWRDAEKYNRERDIQQIQQERQMIEFMVEVRGNLALNRLLVEKVGEMAIVLKETHGAQLRLQELFYEYRPSAATQKSTSVTRKG